MVEDRLDERIVPAESVDDQNVLLFLRHQQLIELSTDHELHVVRCRSVDRLRVVDIEVDQQRFEISALPSAPQRLVNDCNQGGLARTLLAADAHGKWCSRSENAIQ